jgi:hypothetical protein
MSKRTRLFVLIAAAVLIVGLGTGLLASYLDIQTLTIVGSAGPDELSYVPDDSRMLAFANVRDVMDSELRRQFADATRDRPDPSRDFEAKTGINVERDIDTVVASISGSNDDTQQLNDDTQQMSRFLVLARGRFDQVRIRGLMMEQGGEVEQYKGKELLTAVDDDHQLAVAFVEPDLVAFGAAPAVRRAIDTKSGATPDITRNKEVMDIVRDIDTGNAWAVGRFDDLARTGRLPGNLAGQLPPITWFAATGHINGGVEGLLRAEASTEQAANDLKDVLRGFMALARLQTGRGQNAEIAAMLNSLQLGGSGRTVSLSFSVPSEVISSFAQLNRQRRNRLPDTPDVPNPPDRRGRPRPQASL